MKYYLLLILLIPFSVFSQKQIQGIITDANTTKPLPFATVLTNTNLVSLTNVDGTFVIKWSENINSVKISYVGYEPTTIQLNNTSTFIQVKLKQKTESLNEVLITAKENPALQIIRQAIANKAKNNIEQSLNSFKFNSYTKLLVTAHPDSISNEIDTIYITKNGEKTISKIDSTNFKFKKEIEDKHLYISEKISEFQFQKGKKTKEIILASRMAGLQNPVYELLALTFQDFSFYNEHYTVAGTNYINPIATNALKHYNYKILDTVKTEKNNSILIYYKPKENKNFKGIEGVLYIDEQSFAITKGVAELKAVANVKTTQNYTYKKECNCWFPIDNSIIIKKGDTKENVNLFGGIVKISSSEKKDTLAQSNKNEPSDIIYFISNSANSNIEINPKLKVKNSSATLLFDDNAAIKSEDFWNTYRTDSISKRDTKTYFTLDSIAKKEKVESKIDLARNFLKGYYHTKYLNLNLGKIINLNNYEGLRIGFGGETNQNFSKKFKIESYVAYGTKDTNIKYSFGGSFRLAKESNTWFGTSYTNDIKEAASLNFIAENTSFSPINPRNLNIDKFYKYETFNAFIEHDLQPNLETKIQLSTGDYATVFDYSFVSPTKNVSEYHLTTATLNIQYSPKNEYMNSPIGKLKIKNEFPQFTIQATKSFNNLLDGTFDFMQLNLRILHKIKPLRKGSTSILLESGLVLGDAPISHLFNATPNYTYKNPWAKRITFAGKNSFETMGYNEFISDKFAALHLKQNFEPFRLSKKFKPQISLASRIAFGDIAHPEFQNGFTFQKMNKGYLESGFEINSLAKGFGFSAFYRYGAYSNALWHNNLAVKLTYKLSLGF